MFEDDFLAWGLATNTFLTREEASAVYAAKDDIPEISGGLDITTADNRYAPKSGSLVYATKLELPDVSGKANTTDVDAAFTGVATALAGKAATTHDHSGVYATAGHHHDLVYAPKTGSTEYATKTELTTGLSGKQATGAYLVAADIAGKANTADVTTALAGKSDTTHDHSGVYATAGHHHDLVYAPKTGSTEYATKAELSTATGGGLTETSANALYARLDAMFTPVTDVTDVLYAPISGSTVYAAKTEIPDVSGKANTTEVDAAFAGVATALAGKSDTTHTHAGVYATETQLNDVTSEVSAWAPADRNVPIDTQFAAIGHTHDTAYAPISGSLVYATKLELPDISGKANTADVTTALAGKSDTNHTHDYSALQTTANMVKVGSETTYYSGAKVDALLGTIGGGTTPTVLRAYTSPVMISGWNRVGPWIADTWTYAGGTVNGQSVLNNSPLTLVDHVVLNNTNNPMFVICTFRIGWFLNPDGGERIMELTMVPNPDKLVYSTASYGGWGDNATAVNMKITLTSTFDRHLTGRNHFWATNTTSFVLPSKAWFQLNACNASGSTQMYGNIDCTVFQL